MFKRLVCVGCGPVPLGCLGTVCQACKDTLTERRLQAEEMLREQNERLPASPDRVGRPAPLREAA